LGFNKPTVGTIRFSEQFLVGALLDDRTFTYNEDAIGIPDGRQPMSDSDRCTA
jgi:hypothetical protein